MAYDDQNIFARILRGELPAYKVHEDEASLAFMDLMPHTPGHTLVIPKAAAENLFDIEPEALAMLVKSTQRVARAVRAAFQPPGLVITQFNGTAAGQTVFHVHFHIIPRYEDQAASQPDGSRKRAADEVLAEHARRVRAALAEL